MLQQEKPDDYVIATEESHTVEEFLEEAFGYVGLDWKDYVEIDPRSVLDCCAIMYIASKLSHSSNF
jgi:GDP-D-mannose dehydratase